MEEYKCVVFYPAAGFLLLSSIVLVPYSVKKLGQFISEGAQVNSILDIIGGILFVTFHAALALGCYMLAREALEVCGFLIPSLWGMFSGYLDF